MKRFNVTGTCIPEENYMVDIGGKVEKIKKLVDNRSYFTINKARQYGKTTTLAALERFLRDEYIVASISFEGLGDETFGSQELFCPMFIKRIVSVLRFSSAPKGYREKWASHSVTNFDSLSDHITDMCENEKVVLLIDEVDRTSNNRVFLQFLGMLRDKFLARRTGKDHTFHSVVLAGVYDIKNIKLKMISEGLCTPLADESKLYNSPWNIAASFAVDMSFGPEEIATMLAEYETDHKTGMDIAAISGDIHSYTGGYPFLVSRICQCIDEDGGDWTAGGVKEAVKMLLEEKNTLFDDLRKNIEMYPELKRLLRGLLLSGERFAFNVNNATMDLGHMFGYLKGENGMATVANRVFEAWLYNYFVSEQEISGELGLRPPPRGEVAEGGRLDMELLLRRFAQHYMEIYRQKDAEFLERHGGLLFLTYLKPFVNGHGYCHIESQTNDFRIDIAVDYGSEQHIVELKIWNGQKEHERAYGQLANYLGLKGADVGYLLSFDFRKEVNKERKSEWVDFGGKKIFDVIV